MPASKPPPIRFTDERSAVNNLISLYRIRDKARVLKAELKALDASDKHLSEAFLAYFAEQGPDGETRPPVLEDKEHAFRLECVTRNKPAVLDVPNVPDDLLIWAAQTGAIVGRVTTIRGLPEGMNRERLMRYVMPGGTFEQLTFGTADDDDGS